MLGVDHKTVIKYLRQEGVPTKKAGSFGDVQYWERYDAKRRESLSKRPSQNRFAIWLRANPHRRLPRSLPQIAEQTGVPYRSITAYMNQLRTKIRAMINELPDLRNHNIRLEQDHLPFSTKHLEDYSIAFSEKTLEVRVIGHTKTRSINTPLPYAALIDAWNKRKRKK